MHRAIYLLPCDVLKEAMPCMAKVCDEMQIEKSRCGVIATKTIALVKAREAARIKDATL
jgi:hypothetical protein